MGTVIKRRGVVYYEMLPLDVMGHDTVLNASTHAHRAVNPGFATRIMVHALARKALQVKHVPNVKLDGMDRTAQKLALGTVGIMYAKELTANVVTDVHRQILPGDCVRVVFKVFMVKDAVCSVQAAVKIQNVLGIMAHASMAATKISQVQPVGSV